VLPPESVGAEELVGNSVTVGVGPTERDPPLGEAPALPEPQPLGDALVLAHLDCLALPVPHDAVPVREGDGDALPHGDVEGDSEGVRLVEAQAVDVREPLLHPEALAAEEARAEGLTEEQPLAAGVSDRDAEGERVLGGDALEVREALEAADEESDGGGEREDDAQLVAVMERLPLPEALAAAEARVEGLPEAESLAADEARAEGLPEVESLAADEARVEGLPEAESQGEDVSERAAEGETMAEALALEKRDALLGADKEDEGVGGREPEGENEGLREPLPQGETEAEELTRGDKLPEEETLVDGESEREAEGEWDCAMVGVAESEGVSREDKEGVGKVEEVAEGRCDGDAEADGLLLCDAVTVEEPKGALNVGEALAEGESRKVADKRGVPLEEVENTPEPLDEAETQLETEGQAEVEGSRDGEALAEPQSEGLPVPVRATLPVALAKEEAEIDAVGDAAMLPEKSALPVGCIPDAVTLAVELKLDEEQAEDDAAPEGDASLLTLVKGLPLTDCAAVPDTLDDGDTEVQEEPVS
jgi:hypothetical protein